ncbi:MAG: hypothetical protein V3U80_02795 [Flavobacteriaceae bacterium]
MDRKLISESQIENLYKFTRDHYVYWYDLQSELVDHLANDIEEIWIQEPNLTFENAKNKSFKKFGVCGFMEVIDERSASLSKKYRKMIWKEFITFLTIPKITVTISFIWAVSFLLKNISFNRELILGAILLVSIYPLYHRYKNTKRIKKTVLETDKKWYFEEIITNLGDFGSAMQIPFHIIYIYSDDNFKNSLLQDYSLLFATGFVVFALLVYIATMVIPSKVRALIAKENPEYKIA